MNNEDPSMIPKKGRIDDRPQSLGRRRIPVAHHDGLGISEHCLLILRRKIANLPDALTRPAGPSFFFTARKILLMEEEREVAHLLYCWLRQARHFIRYFPEVGQAVERIRGEPFDLVVINWGHTGKGGITDCRGFRAIGEIRKIRRDLPVLVVSGHPCRAKIEAAALAHKFAVLFKPFRSQELFDAVDRCLGGRGARGA